MNKSIFLIHAHIILIFILIFPLSSSALPLKPFRIPQNGMYPNLPAGSYFWMDSQSYQSVKDIQRGDIIVFKKKIEGKQYTFVWRVLGLPGDRIKIKGQDVILNGKKLQHNLIREEGTKTIFEENNGQNKYLIAYEKAPKKDLSYSETTVPPNSVYVLGDNRNNARDSLYLGFIPFDSIIGKRKILLK